MAIGKLLRCNRSDGLAICQSRGCTWYNIPVRAKGAKMTAEEPGKIIARYEMKEEGAKGTEATKGKHAKYGKSWQKRSNAIWQ